MAEDRKKLETMQTRGGRKEGESLARGEKTKTEREKRGREEDGWDRSACKGRGGEEGRKINKRSKLGNGRNQEKRSRY